MRKLMKKLRSRRGDTFVEVLIAVLIVAFGCLVIGTMFASAMTLNLSAKAKDDAYYEALSQMEQADKNAGTQKVEVTDGTNSATVETDKYGNDELYSYRKNYKEQGKS